METEAQRVAADEILVGECSLRTTSNTTQPQTIFTLPSTLGSQGDVLQITPTGEMNFIAGGGAGLNVSFGAASSGVTPPTFGSTGRQPVPLTILYPPSTYAELTPTGEVAFTDAAAGLHFLVVARYRTRSKYYHVCMRSTGTKGQLQGNESADGWVTGSTPQSEQDVPTLRRPTDTIVAGIVTVGSAPGVDTVLQFGVNITGSDNYDHDNTGTSAQGGNVYMEVSFNTI
jgi:hypothetical protein